MLARRARPAITKAATVSAISTVTTEAAAISAISAVTTEATAITAVATKATTIAAVTAAKAAAALGGWCGAFELEFGCHGLAAVLGNLERHALSLAEALRAGCCQCGNVYEHVRTTTIR
jgi:hypothetical protein